MTFSCSSTVREKQIFFSSESFDMCTQCQVVTPNTLSKYFARQVLICNDSQSAPVSAHIN